MEQGKRQVSTAERMSHLGQLQQQCLEALTNAAEQSGRRDLCRFLLMALAELVTEATDARNWIDGLNLGNMRLIDRGPIYARASTFLAFARQLRKWSESCAAIGYFDEGYPAAQLWLADWERYDGERATQRALALVKNLDPLSGMARAHDAPAESTGGD
jgi:hypothetical protein